MRDAALEVARGLAALARAENDAALVELRKRGVTVTRLTATGRAAFAAATRGVYDKWAAVIGAGPRARGGIGGRRRYAVTFRADGRARDGAARSERRRAGVPPVR